VNRVELTGRLAREPMLREAGGRPLCILRLAVHGMGERGAGGFVDVVIWGRAAREQADRLRTGWLVAVSGRLRYREWRDAHDRPRSGLSVVGDVEALAAPRARREPGERAAA
jgi:single stranded DNA-binding protein